MRDDELLWLAIAAGAAALLYRFGGDLFGAIDAGAGAIGAGGEGITVEDMYGGGTFASYSPASSPASSPSAYGTGGAGVGGSGFGSLSPAPGAMQAVNVSSSGADFIKRQEGLTLTVKPDAGGSEIGYGHQWRSGDPQTVTPAGADALLAQDLQWVESTINSAVSVPLSQNQFDALASLVYNIGAGAFLGSTLLRRLNAGDYQGAASEFPRWNKSQNQVSGGLIARRAAEQGVFLA